MNDLSVVMQAGRERLARVRAERKAREERKQQEERERLAAYWGNFRESLKRLVPEPLHGYLQLPGDDRERDWFVRVPLNVPGCVGVLLELNVTQDGSASPHNTDWIVVPGVRSYPPVIDPNEGYFSGDVEVIYFEGRGLRCDDGMAVCEEADLELALALAEERQAYIDQQRARIEEEQRALEPALRELETAVVADVKELIYQPLEDANQVEEILNKGELARFVRGLVEEALEERGY